MIARRAPIGLVALFVALFATAPAQAGVYTVYGCLLPSGAAAPATGWGLYFSGPNNFGSPCKELGLGTGATHANDEGVDFGFLAPASTQIDSYTIWRAGVAQPASTHNYAFEFVENAGADLRIVEKCSGLAGCAGIGDLRQPWTAANMLRHTGRSGVSQIRFKARCWIGGGGRCPATAPGPAAQVRMFRSEVTLRDESPPVLTTQPSGTLLDGSRPLAGVQQVSLAAADQGGGVYQARFEVDGRAVATKTIDDNGGRCVRPFTDPVPCARSVSATLDFDTALVPDGEHLLRIVVTDATTTNTVIYGPVRITTRNAPPASSSPSVSSACDVPKAAGTPVKLLVSLSSKRGRRTRTVRYGAKVRVFGRLTTSGGAPIAGAAVCVSSRSDAAGASSTTIGTVTTDASGQFVTQVEALTSRAIRVAYRTASGAVAASTVRLKVPARVSVHASRGALRNGRKLVLSGRVRGQGIPAQGLLVEIQSKRANGWQTFRNVRADRRGRFRAGYRFTRTVGVARYLLRARLPQQPVFAYATGASRPVLVRVRG